MGGEIEKLQSMGLGMQPGGGGNSVPAAPTEKPKKVTPISKQVTNKISSSSAKLTELMAWESKIKDNTVLSLGLMNINFNCFLKLEKSITYIYK